MSEFFYGPPDCGDELKENQNNTFTFLENAKLIGEEPKGLNIYLEDYVYTYLYQYAKTNRGEEKGAALVGYYTEELGKKAAIISGAIQFEDLFCEGEVLVTEPQIKEMQKKINRYFPDCELMGWMHTQPGYGIFLTTQDIRIHQDYFRESYQSFMIIDPIENAEAFFIWDEEEIKSAEGYYMYYDKNERMQEYMVNHKVGASNEELNDEKEDVVMHFRKKDKMRKQEIQNKKIYNLVTALSIVLFLMCVTMAVGLIQHRDRLAKLENELDSIDSSYTSLLTQLSHENVQVVFAETEEIVPADTHKEVLEDIELSEESMSTEERMVIEEIKEESIIQETEETVKENDFDTYTVQRGDNLNRICYNHYKTTEVVNKIVDFNELESPNKIYEGQVLKLPPL
ncbi:MAG: LysM peptidoglycan-binding domain-containing protein [Epulopiscium sp.]|nr:LysM peptidoglycan-binding domain-containing protein [Candidatus Epulonipiscium sp.]